MTLNLDDQKPTAPEIPRLSPTIAKEIINRSPKHAWQAHRLLGGGDGDGESTKAQDTGKILEALVFGAGLGGFEVLQFDSYRTKDAQAARDEAKARGLTPILASDLETYTSGARIIRERIADHGIEFRGGEYQKLLEWTCQATDANCKGYLDYFQDGVILDLKTTSDASPRKVQRSFVEMGNDLQGEAYRDGIETLFPQYQGRSRMIFIYAETDAPWVVQLYEASGMMQDLGAQKWHSAKETWVHCLTNNYWPTYFSGIGQLDPLPWQMEFEPELLTKEVK